MLLKCTCYKPEDLQHIILKGTIDQSMIWLYEPVWLICYIEPIINLYLKHALVIFFRLLSFMFFSSLTNKIELMQEEKVAAHMVEY